MKKSAKPVQQARCPCGGGILTSCCEPLLNGNSLPFSALDLMRSRYTAYVQRNESYLQSTWYGSTRPITRILSEGDAIQWQSLDILRHHEEGTDATVEFIARYKVNGKAFKLHEISRFVREDGKWFYLDGSFPGSQ